MEPRTILLRALSIFGITVGGGFALLQCSSSTEPDEPLINRVYVGDVEVTAGDRFAVPVFFDNEVNIGAMNIPLDYDTTYLRCDSISFVGSRAERFLIRTFGLNDSTPNILIVAIDSAAGAPPGRGLIANAHFWAYGYAPDTLIEISSPTNPQAGLNLGFRDTSLTNPPIIPEFDEGSIRVNAQ